MIPVNGLIALFAQMYREHWAYKWGSAKRGEVDCSGAFVWAYRQFGESIYHGSNSIARYSCAGMGKEPKPGYAAFKWRAKDTAKYPDGRGDYYHIGLVAEDGAHVYEARGTKTGFTRSAVSSWQWFAPLADVEYGNPIPPSTPVDGPPFPASWEGQNVSEGGGTMEPYNAVVSTASGSLNMRSGPGLSYPVTFKLPKGTPVTVLIEYSTGWAFVDEDGTQGYVSLKYLTRTEGPESAHGTESYPTAPRQAPEGLDPAAGGIGVSDPDQCGRSPLSSKLAREEDGGSGEGYGVWIPCASAEEAARCAANLKGAVVIRYEKPPDEKGGD